MEGALSVSVSTDQGHRRDSRVFRNIRVSPRVSDARIQRPRHSSFLRSIREVAVIVPQPVGVLTPRSSKNLESIEEAVHTQQKALGPPPLPLRQPSHIVATISMFGYSLAPLYDLWEKFQVSHCGQYSVERMLALEEYCNRTSFKRVLTVCAIAPLLPLFVIVVIEVFPLRPPDDGAGANYVFWIRHDVTVVITVMSMILQAKSCIPELSLSIKQALVIAVSSAAVYGGLGVLVAELWVFPIPFLALTGSPALAMILAIASRLVLGPYSLEGVQDGDFRGRRFLQIIAAQSSLFFIYQGYQALFVESNGFFQLLLVALLPVINLAMKNTLVALGTHLEDNLPEMIVFTVDIFSSVYSVICMRGTNSFKMVAVTVLLNILVMVLSLHGMNRRSRVARESRAFFLMQLQQRKAQRTPSFLSASTADGSPELLRTLVATTLKLLQVPGQLDSTELRAIRLLSGKQHKLSDANSAILQSLAARCVYNNDRRMSEAISMVQIKSRYASAAIEGRVLGSVHFVVAPQPTSRLAQRIRAALLTTAASARIGSGVDSRLVRSFSVRSGTSSGKTTSNTNSSVGSFPRLPSSPRMAKLVKASSKWISGQMSTPKKQPPVDPAPLPTVFIDPDTSAKLRPLVMASKPILGDILVETRRKNTKAVKQSLQLLFNNEYLGLIAYTQFFIPVLYLLFMSVLQALPNQVYYPMHLILLDHASQFIDRMTVISILAILQLAVLIVLHVLVATRFAVSTNYQIAFVLETHFTLVEGRLITWLIFAIQSTLLHFGVDFTFRFLWIHRR